MTDEIIDARIKAIGPEGRDKYGQVKISSMQVHRLFPEEQVEEVNAHLETSTKYGLSTYGTREYTYEAIYLRHGAW